MTALLWLLPLTLMLGGGALCAFLWCTRNGQFDDLDGAAWRILQDDAPRRGSGKAEDREG